MQEHTQATGKLTNADIEQLLGIVIEHEKYTPVFNKPTSDVLPSFDTPEIVLPLDRMNRAQRRRARRGYGRVKTSTS